MSEGTPRPVEKLDRPTLDMPRLDTGTSFRKEAYAALKRAITAMDIYDHAQEIRLDERRFSEGLGGSGKPGRGARPGGARGHHHADPRGADDERAGRLRPHPSAPRHLRRAQDQARYRRD